MAPSGKKSTKATKSAKSAKSTALKSTKKKSTQYREKPSIKKAPQKQPIRNGGEKMKETQINVQHGYNLRSTASNDKTITPSHAVSNKDKNKTALEKKNKEVCTAAGKEAPTHQKTKVLDDLSLASYASERELPSKPPSSSQAPKKDKKSQSTKNGPVKTTTSKK